jgi:polygalacturonase
LVDGGVSVFASRNPADYQIAGNEVCGTVGTAGNGCNPLINIAGNAASSGAAIMGYGIIDGRG